MAKDLFEECVDKVWLVSWISVHLWVKVLAVWDAVGGGKRRGEKTEEDRLGASSPHVPLRHSKKCEKSIPTWMSTLLLKYIFQDRRIEHI